MIVKPAPAQNGRQVTPILKHRMNADINTLPPPPPPSLPRIYHNPAAPLSSPLLQLREQQYRPQQHSQRYYHSHSSYSTGVILTSATSSFDLDYSSQSTIACDPSHGSRSLDGCEISISSTSYGTATDHLFVGHASGITVILYEGGGNHKKMTNVYREETKDMHTSSTTGKKNKSRKIQQGGRNDSNSKSLRWKEKRKKQQANIKKRRPTSATVATNKANGNTPVMSNISNRKQLSESAILVAGSTSNLFLTMGDKEIGNHHSINENVAISSATTTTIPNMLGVSCSNDSNAMEIFKLHEAGAGPGLGSAPARQRFRPGSIGNSYDSTTDDDEDEDDYYDYHPTPMKSGLLPKDGGMAETEKSSPQLVMAGAGMAMLTSFPRYQKNRGGRHSSSLGNSSDMSYDDSEMTMADDEATFVTLTTNYESITGHHSDEDTLVRNMSSIQKALFHSNPLDKFHDFITGNACWSDGKNAIIGRIQEGCADTSTVVVMDDYDYVEEEEDTLAGSDGEEMDTLNDGEWEETEDDYSIEVNLFDDGINKVVPNMKNRKSLQQQMKKDMKSRKHVWQQVKQQQKQQQPSRQQKSKSSFRLRSSHTQQRRGRSPTVRHGHNSDGESIRNSSLSRSRCSPGDRSLSFSTRNSSVSPNGNTVLRLERPIMVMDISSLDREMDHLGEQDGDPSVNAKGSVAAESIAESSAAPESVADSVLSQDQAAWVAMTMPQQPFPLRTSHQSRHSGAGADKIVGGGTSEQVSKTRMDARNEVDGDNGGNNSPAADNDVIPSMKQREHSPVDPWEANATEGYFKKLLSVGIHLVLNDPPNTSDEAFGGLRLNRSGKMFLRLGSCSNSRFGPPHLLWTDGHHVSYTLDLVDIQSIHQPMPFELANYPFAMPSHSFFLTTNDASPPLLFEAVDDMQMMRITLALRGIVSSLARKIVMGESDWVVQMMLASSGGGGQRSLLKEELVDRVPCTIADVTNCFVGKTSLMRQAQERRSKIRSMR